VKTFTSWICPSVVGFLVLLIQSVPKDCLVRCGPTQSMQRYHECCLVVEYHNLVNGDALAAVASNLLSLQGQRHSVAAASRSVKDLS